jgi:hypothetical protein
MSANSQRNGGRNDPHLLLRLHATRPMKHFEMLVKAYTTLVVEAEDDLHAHEIASDALNLNGFDLDEISIEKELKTPEEVESAIRHSEYHSHDFRKKPYADE